MLVRYRLLLGAWLACLAVSQTGCVTFGTVFGKKRGSEIDTSMLEAQGYSIPPGGMPSLTGSEMGHGSRLVLEVRDGSENPHLESIPYPADQSMFVEDVIQQAKLHKELGRMRISIMRPNGTGQPPVRLDLTTDDQGRPTSAGTNYALQPGDHLIILEDQRSGLERFIKSQFTNG